MAMLFDKHWVPVLVSVVLVFSACSYNNVFFNKHSSASGSIIKSPNDNREYASIVLDNQLELILVSDPSIEQSTAAISVAVGSYQEPEDFAGLAHYLEHMLFMGTKSYPDAAQYGEFISRNGGVENAYTELDHTNYMVAVNNSAFDEALARFSRYFYEAKLDAVYAEKERKAVHSEWVMKSPNDWVILEQLNGLTLHPEHPISRFNWGNLTSLTDQKNKTLHAALTDFYNTYYSANLMKGTIISPLPIHEIKMLAAKHFAQIPNKKTARPQVSQAVAKPEQLNKIVRYAPQTDMKQLQVKFVIDNNSDQFKTKPNGYVQYLLANEMPGSLASELRNLGLSEAVYASYDADKYVTAGDFTLYIDLTESGVVNRDQIMGAILRYLRLLKAKGVNKQYFAEIQRSLSNSFRFKEQSDDYTYAMEIAARLQQVSAEFVLSSEYEYQQFDPNAIERVLGQLSLKNARLFYIDKEQSVDKDMQYFSGKYSVENIEQTQMQKWIDISQGVELSLPRRNTLMPDNFDLLPAIFTDKPTLLVHKKGYSLHLGHSALFQQPKGQITFELNTGFTKASARNHVLSDILNRVLQQKLTELQSEAFAAGMGISVHVANGLSISISGFTDKQALLLKKGLAQILSFELQDNELNNYLSSYKSDMQSTKKQVLLEQLFPKFRQILNLDNYSDQALLNETNNITVADLIQFKEHLLKRANLRVFAFGNYSTENVKKMSEWVLQTLPKERFYSDIYHSPEFSAPSGQIYNWQQDSPMTDIAFVDTYMKALDIEDLAALKVLARFLQPALFQQIRAEQQLAYTVGFFNQKINAQILFGFYIQSAAKGLSDVHARLRVFQQNFSQQLALLTKKDFETAKNSILLAMTQPAKNLAEEMQADLLDWQMGDGSFESKDLLTTAINKTSIEDVINMYRRMQKSSEFGRLMVQFRGRDFKSVGYISLPNMNRITELETFHKKYLKNN